MSPDRTSASLRFLADFLEARGRPGPRRAASMVRDVLSAVAALAPTAVPTASYEATGADLPPLFHAGRTLVEGLSTDHFMEGWYGWGFYAAFDPEYVRRWYGPVVTRLRAKPDARVLIASVAASAAPPGLFDLVMEREAAAIGDEAKTDEMRGYLSENQAMWVHALDRIAIEDYAIVVYSDQQVVVKDPEAVVTEGEQPRPEG